MHNDHYTIDKAQRARAEAFRALHQRPGLFVIPNPWDAGSARMLAGLGFEALATTSAGLAFSLGRLDGDGSVTRAEMLDNIRVIAGATDLPVSADLENGFAEDPEACAATIQEAAKLGLVGGSIEDATGDPANPIFDFDLSVARIRAAVTAARRLPFPFTLTARAENLLHGRQDLDDTIRRLSAYAEAGADVLYAPGLQGREEILRVVRAVAPRPVNVLLGLNSADMSLDALAEAGVKRVSVGSALARVAYGAFYQAAAQIAKQGSTDVAGGAMSYKDFNALFQAADTTNR